MGHYIPTASAQLTSGLPACLWDETHSSLADLLLHMNAVTCAKWETGTGDDNTIMCSGCKQCVVKYSDARGFKLLGFHKRVRGGEREDCCTHSAGCFTPLPNPDLHRRAQATSHIPPSLFDERFPSLGGLVHRMDDVTGGMWVPGRIDEVQRDPPGHQCGISE
ncbi:hypothetical protein KIPB_012784 [Kipferlia bialata]|uniref:Uncharacterized protein n=1 Tax=Kipferlia bialata TaxID=797122 RepID=A0A9K3GP78_9EUKA|nr:hypothetical protein KIPB_012784 [Kipferlia bialata]|eukprot:g12784.t1